MTGSREILFEYEVPYDELPHVVGQERQSAENLQRTTEKIDEFLRVNVRPVERTIDE